MLCCYSVSVGRKMITIFDLSFAAIPDLNKQAEDIDFFFEEYIRYNLFQLKRKQHLDIVGTMAKEQRTFDYQTA